MSYKSILQKHGIIEVCIHTQYTQNEDLCHFLKYAFTFVKYLMIYEYVHDINNNKNKMMPLSYIYKGSVLYFCEYTFEEPIEKYGNAYFTATTDLDIHNAYSITFLHAMYF